MTYYDVYVAAFEDGDALEWGELARTGHISHRISPLFSAYGLDKGPYEVARDWMRDGRMTSMKVDWGAYAANVDVPDIRRFVSACYGASVPQNLEQFLAELAPGRYALVACET